MWLSVQRAASTLYLGRTSGEGLKLAAFRQCPGWLANQV